jgi:uncharacterized protein
LARKSADEFFINPPGRFADTSIILLTQPRYIANLPYRKNTPANSLYYKQVGCFWCLLYMNDELYYLWEFVTGQFHSPAYSIHGPDHWRRVESNGLFLATRTGADIAIVRLFALFHDSRRVNDGWDEGHGARGAEYAKSLRGTAFDLSDDRFELLHYACVWHTDGDHHDHPTIATCWDADRLDLGRVGVMPDPERMCTNFGREIAVCGSIQAFIQSTVKSNESGGGLWSGGGDVSTRRPPTVD